MCARRPYRCTRLRAATSPLEPEWNQTEAHMFRSATAPHTPPRNSVRICHQRVMHRPTYGPSRKKRPAETTLLTAEMTLITWG